MTRLDRGMYTVPIWWGLVFSGIYVLASPPIIHTIPPLAEDILAVELLAFALLCLTGSRIDNTELAYRVEIVGLAGIALVLGILAVATELTLWQQFTLSGGLGALVQIGSLRMIAQLTLALRK